MQNGRGCENDWLEITFSNRPAIRLCGMRRIRRLISGAGPTNVTFGSDESVDDFRGFWMLFRGTYLVFLVTKQPFDFILKSFCETFHCILYTSDINWIWLLVPKTPQVLCQNCSAINKNKSPNYTS